MGCSPSKSNNFVTMNPHRKNNMLPSSSSSSSSSQPKDQHRDVFAGEGHHGGVKPADVEIQEKNKLAKTPALQREAQKTSMAGAVSLKAVLPQRQETHKQEGTEKKSGKKTKKNTRGTKGVKRKDKDKAVEQKVDFPEQLVKAHQAAYAFLNPNINKYDAVLELLEQATQTQESVQPMVAFMALSYEQTILVLEEIADEGELVMKEYGDHLAWPSLMKNLSPAPSSKSGSGSDQPSPDLLQQLLQYTTQRMRNVSQTVGGLGDSALEEAVEYFASVAQLLEEKLKVKRTAETRLMQLLARVEMASLRKPGPEDSALFSEDSGIGGESESIAGSERRLRRESCGSTGTNRTTPSCPRGPNPMNIRRRGPQQISPSDSLSSLNSLGSTGTLMAHEHKEPFLASVYISNDGVDDQSPMMEEEIKCVRFNKLLNRESHQPRCISTKRIENPRNVEMKMKNAISGRINFVPNSSAKTALTGSPQITRRQWSDENAQTPPKRPQTAAPVRRAAVKTTPTAIDRRSRSAESLRNKSEDPTLLELERTQKTLNQRLQKINKGASTTKNAPSKQKKGISSAQSPKVNPKRQLSGKKSHPISPQDQGGLTQSDVQKQETTSDVEENCEEQKKTFHFLVRATPPPSPPMSPKPSTGFHRGRKSVKKLIDSFSQEIEDHDGANVLGPLKGVRKCGVPVLPGWGNVEAALSAKNCGKLESTSTVDLDSLPPPPLEVLMDNSYESAEMVGEDEDSKTARSPVVKRAAMSRLRTSVQSVLPSKGSFPQGSRGLARANQRGVPSNSIAGEPGNQTDKSPEMNSSSLQRSILHRRNSFGSQSDESTTYDEESSATIKDAGKPSVPPYPVAISQPPPAALRGRLLPSTPSTQRTSNRRLPSPHNTRRQPTPPSTASPPVCRKLSSPTETRRVLTSPSQKSSFSSYAFKAPSPPASPKLQRREKNIEDSARSFNNARSVFCPASPTLFEAPPCPRPPQAWTCSRVSFLSRAWEGRGTFPVQRPLVRRSHSGRRPSLTLPRPSRVSVAETCGSEPSISTLGLDDEPTIEDDFWGQSNFSLNTRSASHPDLCVVGHAFHRD